jgi:hypothetical protein
VNGTPWALLSGFAGALLVFVLGIVREWWRNERERRGLLRLLLAEIEHNAVVVNTIAERRGQRTLDWIGHPDLPSMKAETWRDVRDKAAALFPSDLLEAVNGYYSPLETSLTLLRFPDAMSDSADRWLRGEIKQVKPEWDVAATENPYRDYLEQTLAAQDAARDRIKGYLALSVADALLLSAARLLKPRKRRS